MNNNYKGVHFPAIAPKEIKQAATA